MPISKDRLAQVLNVKNIDGVKDGTTPDQKPKPEQTPPQPPPAEGDKPIIPGDNLGLDLSNVMDDKPPAVAEPVVSDPQAPDPTTKDGRAFAAMRKQIQELESKLAQVQSQPPTEPEELKTLREQLQAKDRETEELMNRLAVLDLERDPRFQAKYQQLEQTLDEQIRDTAKELDVPEDVIAQVMSMPLRRRIEYLNEEASHAAPTLLTLFAQRDALQRQKASELARHKETRAELDKQRGVQDLAMEQQARTRLFESALVSARETGNFVFQEIPGNESRNALVRKATSLAQELFISNDGERQSKAMMLGVAAPIYLHMLHIERQARIKAEQELARRFGKTPSVSGDPRASSGDAGDTDKPKSMTADDAARMVLKRFS